MTNGAYPVLCGGTFFTLILEARKARSGRKEQLYGKRDGLSESETLTGLVKVMYPEFIEPSSGRTYTTNTSDYKLCKNNGGNLPFFEKEIKAFNSRIKNDYKTALIQMQNFADRFIEVGGSVKKDELLVKALLDLIENDQSINDNDDFYVCENGAAIKKAAIKGIVEVYLPAFLLGVWHYIVVYRQDNTVGKSTIDAWCPSCNRKTRVYSGNVGERITRRIILTVPTDSDPESNDDTTIDVEGEPSFEYNESFTEKANEDASRKTTSQVVNFPFVFNQYGNNNIQIGSIDTLTINNN